LNPGRADRSVGSFYIHLQGDKRGRWRDHATGDYGDVLDLIALSLTCNASDALREARCYLGLATETAGDAKRRQDAIAKSKARAKAAAKDAKKRAEERARLARGLLYSAQTEVRGTPVEYYLRDRRGIDFEVLGRVPGSLSYHPKCYYKHTDKKTGDVVKGEFPAMLARVIDRNGKVVAVHRTYLALASDGMWDKAPVPEPKKVLGEYGGACIRLWSGLGPRRGKGAPLAKCPPDTHVHISEGIEDALSGAILWPDARFLAAISLSNLGAVALPENVTSVTLIADRDEHAASKVALELAGQQIRDSGRSVRLWQNMTGGKDLNDALRALQAEQRGECA
ncbi:MAG: toprim domain-containing protein, partial [Pseudomonadota bacterium]